LVDAFVDSFADSWVDATPAAKHIIAPKRPAATPRRQCCAHARSRQIPMHANARQRDLVPLRASADRQIDAGSPALQVDPVSGCRWWGRVLINPALWRGSMLVLP
jgi:hypothetical protein